MYPTDLPLSDIQNVIRIVRTGAVKAEYKQLIASAYEVEGYLLGTFVGEPSPKLMAQAGAGDLLECGKVLEAYKPQLGAEADATAIDPATIAMILQLVMTLIQAWRNKHGG